MFPLKMGVVGEATFIQDRINVKSLWFGFFPTGQFLLCCCRDVVGFLDFSFGPVCVFHTLPVQNGLGKGQ